DFSADGNRLWAGAIGEIGVFERTRVGGWSYRSLNSLLAPEHRVFGDAWNVLAEPGGAIFVTDEKLMRWDGRSFRVWTMPGTRHLRALRADGTIYIQHRSTGVYRMMADGPELIWPASLFGDESI